MNIGQRIKERRKELRMSGGELAERIGKNKATLYRYENGEIENLPLDVLKPIAEALSTTPAYLMGWAEKIENSPVEMSELHVDMITDRDFVEMYKDFRKLDAREKRIIKDLAHSMAATKKEA